MKPAAIGKKSPTLSNQMLTWLAPEHTVRMRRTTLRRLPSLAVCGTRFQCCSQTTKNIISHWTSLLWSGDSERERQSDGVTPCFCRFGGGSLSLFQLESCFASAFPVPREVRSCRARAATTAGKRLHFCEVAGRLKGVTATVEIGCTASRG